MAKATRGIQTTVSINTGYTSFQDVVVDLKCHSTLTGSAKGALTKKFRANQEKIRRLYGSMSATDEQFHATNLQNLERIWAVPASAN